MRVLLVDDEKELVSAMAERLSLRGIDADWVTSGEDALHWADAGNYNLAILDVRIPGMSGLKLKTKLEEKHPDMKFIFITGYGSKNDFNAGSGETEAEYYLAKPINIEVLIEKMNEILKDQGGGP